jgi:hypothetical protein
MSKIIDPNKKNKNAKKTVEKTVNILSKNNQNFDKKKLRNLTKKLSEI